MSEHVVSPKVYLGVFAALLLLTFATVQVAGQDLGPWNTVVALAIAVTKATLVVLYFMHVRYSPRLTWLVVASAFAWLAILLAITLSDYWSRGWLGNPGT